VSQTACGAAGGSPTVALVCSRFNRQLVDRLESGARDALVERGVDESRVDTFWVPGALEIPSAAKWVIDTGRYDALVGIGVVLRGETYHFEVVSDQSAAGLMSLAVEGDMVITNGILTLDTLEQALDRAGGDLGNKGAEAAVAALEMMALRAAIHTA
jgi:6,7-dimethyl-8-ribityllumazine synthase